VNPVRNHPIPALALALFLLTVAALGGGFLHQSTSRVASAAIDPATADCGCPGHTGGKPATDLATPSTQSLPVLVQYLKQIAQQGTFDTAAQQSAIDLLVQNGDHRGLDDLFTTLDALLPSNYFVTRDYARGLAMIGSPAAEHWYKKALRLRPHLRIDIITEYAGWLLEHDRPADALKVLSEQEPGVRFPVLHFYTGVALEMLGRESKAMEHYRSYMDFNHTFAAPSSLRTPGGEAVGLRYDDNPGVLDTCSQAELKLSQMIWGEAESESSGGMAAAGYTARNRVFIYNPQPNCNEKPESGTYCERYLDVLVDNKFQGLTRVPGMRNSDTDAVAYCVFNGLIPDPVAQECPYGPLLEGTWCDGACKYGSETGGASKGGYFMYSTEDTCPSTHPSTDCGVNRGKVCANGWRDHCFYSVD